MISGVLDELLRLAEANGCKFAPDFKQKIITDMTEPNAPESIMWQDFIARRPMEVETYLGSPIKLAREANVSIPRIETLYTILHNLNAVNRNRPKPGEGNGLMPPASPTMSSPIPRLPSQNSHRPMMPPNGNGMPGPRQNRPRNSSGFSQPGGMRRGPPPSMNGGPPNGYPRGPPPPHMNGGSRAPSRRGSMDGNDLEEFSHLVLYDNIPEGQEPPRGESDITLRERELQIRQRELALREQEMRARRGPPPPAGAQRRGPHPMRHSQQVFDEDDDDDYVDPMMMNGGATPPIDPDNFDMMSVTSRKNRKAPGPSAGQLRQNPEVGGPPQRGGRFRPSFGGRNRSSQMAPGAASMTGENILDDPLVGYSSNRYGTVDRGTMGAGSRANSLTATRLDDLQYSGPGGIPGMNGAYPRPNRW